MEQLVRQTSENIISFTASDIGMGPRALRTLATSLPAVVTSINCLANRSEKTICYLAHNRGHFRS